MKIIAIHNEKGGVGKTTTAINVGAELAGRGFRTLLVDLDQQATLTVGLGADNSGATIFSALKDAVEGKESLLPSTIVRDNLSVVPSCKDMVNAELLLLMQEYGRENFLKDLIGRIQDEYDFVLLDCPPAVGMVTINALVAADSMIIPLQPEMASLYGLVSIMKKVSGIQKRINKDLKVLGMVVTQYDARTSLHREILKSIQKQYGGLVFDTVISRNIKIAEAMEQKTDVATYKKKSSGAVNYAALTDEILQRINKTILNTGLWTKRSLGE